MKRYIALLACLLTTETFSQVAVPVPANFSGIWRLSTGNYASIHQDGEAVMVAFLAVPSFGGQWEALTGNAGLSSVRLETIYGNANLVIILERVSSTTFIATQTECTPKVASYTCLPNGTAVTGSRIF
jgi:hypothetical protein